MRASELTIVHTKSAWYVWQFKTHWQIESLTENRFNDTASSAMFQVHERCFSPSLSEFKHTKMRNGAMAHLKTACGPLVGNHWASTCTSCWLLSEVFGYSWLKQSSNPGWSCSFRSAGLSSAVVCYEQQNHFVQDSPGERQRTWFSGSEAWQTMHRDMKHCIQLVIIVIMQ